MTTGDHLWAGWRAEYVAGASRPTRSTDECVFCGLLSSDLPDSDLNIVWRDEHVAAILNAYPYGTGHTLLMPVRHVAKLEDMTGEESQGLWKSIQSAAIAINKAYNPSGMNIGFNLGEGSGAGIPAHLHAHVLPRWTADTNFITSVANAKVLPEALNVTWDKLHKAWPISS